MTKICCVYRTNYCTVNTTGFYTYVDDCFCGFNDKKSVIEFEKF